MVATAVNKQKKRKHFNCNNTQLLLLFHFHSNEIAVFTSFFKQFNSIFTFSFSIFSLFVFFRGLDRRIPYTICRKSLSHEPPLSHNFSDSPFPADNYNNFRIARHLACKMYLLPLLCTSNTRNSNLRGNFR